MSTPAHGDRTSTFALQREQIARQKKALEDRVEELAREIEAKDIDLKQAKAERDSWSMDKDRLETERTLLESEVRALAKRHAEERSRWDQERAELDHRCRNMGRKAAESGGHGASDGTRIARLAACDRKRLVLGALEAVTALKLSASRLHAWDHLADGEKQTTFELDTLSRSLASCSKLTAT